MSSRRRGRGWRTGYQVRRRNLARLNREAAGAEGGKVAAALVKAMAGTAWVVATVTVAMLAMGEAVEVVGAAMLVVEARPAMALEGRAAKGWAVAMAVQAATVALEVTGRAGEEALNSLINEKKRSRRCEYDLSAISVRSQYDLRE